MSEYKPITGELRNMPQRYDNFANVEKVVFDGEDFDRLCDTIDSIHANLERENEGLKAELYRARGEWDYWESTHVELPKDADDEYIRIGDMMECLLDGAKKVLRVGYMTYRPDGWHIALTIEENSRFQPYTPKELRHHHAPTVEDVLRYFVERWMKATCYQELDLLAEYATKLRPACDAE